MENNYMKSLGVVIVLGIIIIIVGIGMSVRNNNQNQIPVVATPEIPVTPTPEPIHHDIIANVAANQLIALPFTVTGTVKGTWFFEGSFPVFMKDVNNNQIGVGLASSTQDWMTPNAIPFSVTLPTVNYQGQGSLVFTKDNPSGEPQFDDSFTIPVVFQ